LDKHFKWGLIFAAIVLIGVIIWQVLPKKAAMSGPAIENSIAVISFENQTGDQSYDYLQKAIPNLLISDLEQTGGFYVATWERMHDLLAQMGQKGVDIIDTDLGFAICQREGIQSIVTGSFVKAGDTFVTDVKILDVATKKMLKSATSRGKGENSILDTQIDELGREIFLGLGKARQELESSQRPITELTTSSMEAYKNFLQGKEDIENLYAMGAQQSLEKAVELDPQFALALLYLSDTYFELGNRASAIETLKNAKAHSEKASQKEKLYIEAQYASRIERDSKKRVRILEELIDKYPKEKDAHYELGMYYYGRGRYNEAVEEFRRALSLVPNMGAALNMLGYSYADLGEYENAVKAFERYTVVMPDDANPLDSMAEQYFKMGNLDMAIEKFKKALEIEPAFGSELRLAYIFALKQDYAETLRLVEGFVPWAGSAGIKAETYLWLSLYDFILGKVKKSLEDLDQVDAWADKAGNQFRHASAQYTRGWMYYDLGEWDRSEESLKRAFEILSDIFPDVKSIEAGKNYFLGLIDLKRGHIDSSKARLLKIESVSSVLSDEGATLASTETKVDHDTLKSEILITEGSSDEAIKVFKSITNSPIPSMRIDEIGPANMPFIQDTLARAYLKSGDIDAAIAEYEKKIVFDPEGHERLLNHPKYRYLLAKLYEEKGDAAKAVEQYEAFLELWKDADPGLPELQDAKKQLDTLRTNN